MAIRPQCSKLSMSYLKEATYGQGMAEEHIVQKFEPNEPVILDIAQQRLDDSATIKGYEFPKDTDLDLVVAQDISIPFSFPCSLSLAGLLYSLALGSVSTAAGSGAGHYIHTITPLDPCVTDSLPSTAWIMGLLGDTASIDIVKGIMLNELKLALDSPGRLTLSGTAFSDGTLTAVANPGGFSWPGTSSHLNWVLGSMGDCTLGLPPTPASIKTKLRSFEFTINNNLDLADGRADVINSGKYLSNLRFGNRSYLLSLKVEGHQGDTFWTYMTSETVLKAVLTVTIDANLYMSFTFPVLKVATVKQSFDGIRDVLDLTFKVFYDTVTSRAILVEIGNHVATYLVSAASPSISGSASRSPSVSVSPSTSVSPSPS